MQFSRRISGADIIFHGSRETVLNGLKSFKVIEKNIFAFSCRLFLVWLKQFLYFPAARIRWNVIVPVSTFLIPCTESFSYEKYVFRKLVSRGCPLHILSALAIWSLRIGVSNVFESIVLLRRVALYGRIVV